MLSVSLRFCSLARYFTRTASYIFSAVPRALLESSDDGRGHCRVWWYSGGQGNNPGLLLATHILGDLWFCFYMYGKLPEDDPWTKARGLEQCQCFSSSAVWRRNPRGLWPRCKNWGLGSYLDGNTCGNYPEEILRETQQTAYQHADWRKQWQQQRDK